MAVVLREECRRKGRRTGVFVVVSTAWMELPGSRQQEGTTAARRTQRPMTLKKHHVGMRRTVNQESSANIVSLVKGFKAIVSRPG